MYVFVNTYPINSHRRVPIKWSVTLERKTQQCYITSIVISKQSLVNCCNSTEYV